MSNSSVETLLAEISSKVMAGATKPASLELFVPHTVTVREQPVPNDVAMAILVDALLREGYWPDGFVDSTAGRTFKYVLSEDG